jgi:hypothetical protein
MNKAGSTSIQQCFRHYSDDHVQYLRLNQLAPPYLDNGNHSHHLEMRFRRDVPAHFFNSPDPVAQKAERARFRADFDRAVAESGPSLIISGEVLFEWSLLQTKRKLARFLRENFERVQGLVYVREPVGYMRSLVQQRIQMRTPDVKRGLGAFYPRYRTRLRGWEAALGKGNLQFIPFEEVARPPEDLLKDFATRTGMDARRVARKRGRNETLNRSLSAEAVSVLLRYRVAKRPRPPHGAEYAADARMVSALMSFGEHRFSLSGQWVQRILARNRHDLRWIERRLAQPLPEPIASTDDITFSSWRDFSDYGESLGPQLAAWQVRAFPKIPVEEGKPEGMLHRLYSAFLHDAGH